MNDRVLGVTQLFARELKKNVSGVGVEARNASNFMTFDHIVQDNELSHMLDSGPASGNNVPTKISHFHCNQVHKKPSVVETNNVDYPEMGVCFGRRHTDSRMIKGITSIDDGPPFRNSVINGVLGVPVCADTGSDANLIGKPVLVDVVPNPLVDSFEPPSIVICAGGKAMQCRQNVWLDVQIVTVEGALALPNKQELCLGKTILQKIGVDLDGILEQLAQQYYGDADPLII
ncbi:hypothetical protein PHMEG_00012853 [Phytophthora megakarya]|uniref:Uncharacterized protein n=1 Tax=Phytophthora megakarya TaxID=4795 RepID=A0A225W869_9STRA|nr:hypothetical protein PHMEG_00012853 [Phytophthora megakarya]